MPTRKSPSSELFWKTYEEGTGTKTSRGLSEDSFAADTGDPVAERLLEVLEEIGGTATLFELAVRAGLPRGRARLAAKRLAKQGRVSVETAKGEDLVLRLETGTAPTSRF